jgi:hypothetical protein
MIWQYIKDNIKRGKLVLEMISGYNEIDNFKVAIDEIKSFCEHVPKNDFLSGTLFPIFTSKVPDLFHIMYHLKH